MERLLELMRDDLRAGFAQVNARLDLLNGQTRRHGEQIAGLEERTSGVLEGESFRGRQLAQLLMDFAAHRARCPFDTETGGSEEYRRLRRRELAVTGTAAAVGMFLLTEIIPMLVNYFHRP